MKTFTKFFFIFSAIFLAIGVTTLQSQIQVQGLIADNEGAASWNADGSGPEPYGVGHSTFTYYIASRDYVNPSAAAGVHVTSIGSDFPLFAQALTDNGFTPNQVKLKMGLASLGNDIEGEDWFTFGNEHHLNFYPISALMTLNGEPMISGITNYMIFHNDASSLETWYMESNFFVPADASGNSSAAVKAVVAAFLLDVAGHELRFNFQNFGSTVPLTGNGRSGSYRNISGNIEKGLPEIPMLGLYAENEGGAGWDADGSGHEPYGNGHSNFVYYLASVDYDDINPSPDAALCHLLDVEKGFQNTILQLQYRGFEIGDIKIKMGLASLGPDVEGEDWGMENGYPWLNEYNNLLTFELNGEPILEMLCDTNKMVTYTNYWSSHSSIGKLYDISQNASVEAQYVALSFLKDIGTHYLEISAQVNSGGTFSGNGRSGGYYNIYEASLVALHEKATFLPEGTLSGNLTLDGSPYYIEGHQLIENGQILTIEPGVRIGVRGPYHFNVKGCIKADGTPDHIITFTSSNPNLWWDGIDFNETPVENDSSMFNHCIFQYGLAQGTITKFNSGGAMVILNVDKIKIRNSVFRHNKANLTGTHPPSGGAICFENSDLLIQKCTFYDNYAQIGGAFLAYNYSNPVISNNLIYQNSSEGGGACGFYTNSSGFVINNTIVDNTSTSGGAFFFYSLSKPVIINNILWGNSATSSGNVAYFSQSPNVGFYYNDIQGGQIGFSGDFSGAYIFNIEDDPLFETGPELTLFYLSGESPCINAGTPDTSNSFYPQYLPATCLCGNPRILNDRIEIGVYELLIDGIDDSGTESSILELNSYPNPFTESTTIEFTLNEDAEVTISICNHLGQQVTTLINERLTAGIRQAAWNGGNLPEGVYLCRMQAGQEKITKKMIKVKQ